MICILCAGLVSVTSNPLLAHLSSFYRGPTLAPAHVSWLAQPRRHLGVRDAKPQESRDKPHLHSSENWVGASGS